METMIEVRQLCKSFVINKKQNHVLRNVDLSIHKGEFIAVMGPSGSGKSTLLYTISGMDHINSGTVEFDHKEISRYNEMEMAKLRLHEMGFIFQQMHFLNNLNIYDNIVLPVELDGRSADDKYLKGIVTVLGLEDKLKRKPGKLSGGQQQRAAIARALVTKPAIILADEPTGNLDSQTSQEVLGLFQAASRRFHQTLVMITHNEEIAQVADRTIRIEDGKIVESGWSS